MLIDNRKQIRKFLDDNLNEDSINNEFYKFEAIVRKKDDPDNIFIKNHTGSYLLHSWLISSVEQYDKYVDEMTELCNQTGARLYLALDKKSVQSVVISLSDYTNGLLQNLVRKNSVSMKNMFNALNSLTSKKEVSIHESKKLLFDIDTEDWDKAAELIDTLYPLCEETGPMTILKSPNGWHIVTDRINREQIQLSENIDLKENALTVVYFNKGE